MTVYRDGIRTDDVVLLLYLRPPSLMHCILLWRIICVTPIRRYPEVDLGHVM
jgi:hypothetical protein